jgi:hypothetical protein
MKVTRCFETSATINPATQRDTFRMSAMHNYTVLRTLKLAGFHLFVLVHPLVNVPSGVLETDYVMMMMMMMMIMMMMMMIIIIII